MTFIFVQKMYYHKTSNTSRVSNGSWVTNKSQVDVHLVPTYQAEEC